MPRLTRTTCLILVLAISAHIPSLRAAPSDDVEFLTELHALRKLRHSVSDPAQTIGRYKQLITSFSDHPRVAEAMYDLGHFYLDKELDPKKTKHWFREAIKHSAQKSTTQTDWIWGKASFTLAGQLRWNRQDEKSVREARDIVHAIAGKFPDQQVTQMRVNSELVMQCVIEENYIGAEHHCRELLTWDSRMGDKPLEPHEEEALQAYQYSAAQYLMQRLPYRPGTKKGKMAWLKRFSDDHKEHKWLEEKARRVNAQLANVEDMQPPSKRKSLASIEPKGGTVRTIFLACNFLVVLVLCALIFKNRIWDRRKLQAL